MIQFSSSSYLLSRNLCWRGHFIEERSQGNRKMHTCLPKSFRRVSSCLLLFAAMSAPGTAMNWHDNMDPAALNGSFLETCAECKVDEIGYLTCRCVNNGGRMSRRSSVGLEFCNRNGPHNRDGQLQCQPIVRGSWSASCMRGMIDQGNTLHAQCKDIGGNYRYTEIILLECKTMILENINGRLQCKP